MQYKQFYLPQRNPSISPQDWPTEWRSHSAYAGTFKGGGAVGHSQGAFYLNRLRDPTLDGAPFDPPGVSTLYDGVGCAEALSPDAFQFAVPGRTLEEKAAETGLRMEDFLTLYADELRVFDRHVQAFRCEEVFVHGGAPGEAAVLRFLASKPGGSRADMAAALERHTGVAQRAAGASCKVVRHAHNLLRDEAPADFPFDGITETWFETADEATRSFADAAFKPVVEDLASFSDPARSVVMLGYIVNRWSRDAGGQRSLKT